MMGMVCKKNDRAAEGDRSLKLGSLCLLVLIDWLDRWQ